MQELNQKKIKICFIISDIYSSKEFEWMAKYLVNDFSLNFILLYRNLNPLNGFTPFQQFLSSLGILYASLKIRGKLTYLPTILKIIKILKKVKPDIVHTHLWEGSLLGLPSAFLAGIKHRVMTRHHSTYNHIYAPSAVKWDKLCNLLSTKIIATSPVVKNVLLHENANEKKIITIPHGLDFTEIKITQDGKNQIKEKYNLQEASPIIGVISRWTHWKGVHITIQAFKLLLKDYPNACLLLLNAQGDYSKEIIKNLNTIPPKNYRIIPFEEDIWNTYGVMDCIVHNPIDAESEAFGQVYIEAMSCGIPLICTISGIAHQIIKNNYNAIVLPYQNPLETYNAIKTLLENPKLKETIIKNAFNSVQQFNIQKKIAQLKNLYESLIFNSS